MQFLSEEDKWYLESFSPIPNGEAYSKEYLLQPIADKDLSIIIPCYNSEEYLRECLDSVVNQITQYNIEVLVINDGSTDQTEQILKEYACKYTFINVISQENKGFSGARNTGIRQAHGRYLMFIDSDDYISPNYIEGLLKAAFENEADICACGYYSFYKSKKYKNIMPNSKRDRGLLNGCFWGKVFKRELFGHIMLPEGYWYEDSILGHLIYPGISSFYSVSSCQYAYRKNPHGITNSSKGKIKALDTIYITDLMISSARELYGEEYILSNNYDLIIEQFYLNQRRLLLLPTDIQRFIFLKQADFINANFKDKFVRRFDRKAYEKSLIRRDFKKSVMTIKLDKFYKILARIHI